jgi:hypothetical protein
VTFANGQKGYLPAAGEVCAWPQNETAINACMDAIGGDRVGESKFQYIWTSTQDSDYGAYYWIYSGGYTSLSPNLKSANNYVRAVSDYSYFTANE